MGSGFSHIETKVRSLQPTAVVTAGSDPQPELQCERPVALWWWKNPRTSALWRQAPLCNVVKQPGVCFADLDLCQYGMSSMVDGAPLRKSISSLTNDSTFASSIEAKCDQSHEHRPIQGRDTAASAVYPPAFARAVFKALCQATKNKQPEVQFPTHTVAHHGPQPGHEPLGADSISFKGKVKPMIAATLKTIHQNLGHPPQKELIRHLHLAGASDAVLRAAEQMVCRTCEKSTKAKLARPAHPAVVLDFNEVIAADILWHDNIESTGLPALNIVDLASTYQVVVPLQGTSAEEVGNAMIRGWMNWVGAPKNLLVDLDSCIQRSFPAAHEREECDRWMRCGSGALAEWSGRTPRGLLQRNLCNVGRRSCHHGSRGGGGCCGNFGRQEPVAQSQQILTKAVGIRVFNAQHGRPV